MNSRSFCFLFLAVCLPAFSTCSVIRSRRADDPNSLEATVMAQGATIEQLEAELASVKARLANQEAKVAFNARISTGEGKPLTGTDTLVLDSVDLNQGGGYDRVTGVFTAPVSGLYVLSLKVTHTAPGRLHVIMVTQTNGAEHEIAEVEASGDDPHYLDRSATVVAVQLSKGQRVWNRRQTDSTAVNVEGAWRTSFTGVLIRPDIQ